METIEDNTYSTALIEDNTYSTALIEDNTYSTALIEYNTYSTAWIEENKKENEQEVEVMSIGDSTVTNTDRRLRNGEDVVVWRLHW